MLEGGILKAWLRTDRGSLSKDQLLKISLYDHVLHGTHSDLEEIGIGSVCKVAINFTSRASVQGNKFVHEIFRRLLPACSISLEIGEAELGDWTVTKLGFKQVNLVQEEDQCRVFEPMRVGN